MHLISFLKKMAGLGTIVFTLVGNNLFAQGIPDSVLTSDQQVISWESVINQEWVLLYFYRGNW